MTRDDLRHEARAVALWRDATRRWMRMRHRPKASLALTLSAYAGLALDRIANLIDQAARALDTAQGGTMLDQNQNLLYGLKRAIATVEACDAAGIEITSVMITDAQPSITAGGTASERHPSPELPSFIGSRPSAPSRGLL